MLRTGLKYPSNFVLRTVVFNLCSFFFCKMVGSHRNNICFKMC